MNKEKNNLKKEETKFYKLKKSDLEKPKILKIILIIFVALIIISATIYSYKYYKEQSNNKNNSNEQIESQTANSIDLNNLSYTGSGIEVTNNTIKIIEAGIYTLTGTSTDSNIIVNTDGDVILILDDANITSKTTAAILGQKANSLTITLKANTTNYLTDGGNSNYDAAIYSNSKLIINGDGTLYVNGNVEEGIATENNDIVIENGNLYITSSDDGINAGGNGGTITINGGNLFVDSNGDGIDSNKDIVINDGIVFVISSDLEDNAAIDSDNSYRINGGTIIALGNGMLEAPSNNSAQKTILFNLDTRISNNTLVSLVDTNNNEIISFASHRNFKTIIISTSDIDYNSYSLYTNQNYSSTQTTGIFEKGAYSNGELLTVDYMTSFEVTSITNWFGRIDNIEMEGNPGNMPI